MSTGEMFGGQLQNFVEPQNAHSDPRSSSREGSPESPALNLKCYGSSATVNNNNNNNTNSSPQTVATTPSPTERPQTPAEPENLSVSSDKDTGQLRLPSSHSNLVMDTGRETPMVSGMSSAVSAVTAIRDFMPHPEPPHPPTSLLGGPSSMYQPFPAVRSSSFYPIEHYFPHPANNPPMMEARHAPPPPPAPPLARTPPR